MNIDMNIDGSGNPSAKEAKVAKVDEGVDGSPVSPLLCWQLHRIYAALVSYRRRGLATPPAARPFDTWFEPGSIWGLERPGDALEFAAFQIGVTLREAAGLVLVEATARRFGAEHGDEAVRWLVAIWASLQPDLEEAGAFKMRHGVTE